MLHNYLEISKESAEFLCSFFYEDIGEMVDHIDEKGIYIMDIACDINHFNKIPVPRKPFITTMMRRCIEKLDAASDAYYNSGNEIMSNFDFDKMLDSLRKVEEESGIVLPNSPTQKIGSEVVDSLPKFKHPVEAKSLDKTKDVNEMVKKFEKGIENAFAAGYDHSEEVCLMWKLDGSTVVLYYENGKLLNAVTRGNGTEGNVINHNAKFIKGIPQTIEYDGKLIVRGEAVMSYKEFERINSELPSDEQYKNPRNLANATIQLLDSGEMSKREICFKAFDIMKCNIAPNIFSERFEMLESFGFDVVPHEECPVELLATTIDSWTENASSYAFPVDGLVVCMEDVMYADTLPGTGHNPNIMRGFAFKWQDETVETTLREIEWSASRTGLLNPVAVFDAVELCGTTVSRASLHNLSYISDMDLRIGDRISVYKANMIIPQVAENLDKRDMKVKNINSYITIDSCPVCGGKIGVSEGRDDTYSLICTNPFCGAKKIGEIVHFCERDCMNIKGLSEKKIEFLVNNGYISGIYDLLYLSNMPFGIQSLDRKKFLCKEEGWDRKSEENLWDAIDKALDTDFISFIHSMGISNIGKGQAKELKKYLDANYDSLYEEYVDVSDDSYDLMGLLTNMVAGGFDFTKIDGFGEVIAKSIFNWVENNLVDPVRQHLDEDDPACEVIRILKMLRFHDECPAKSSNDAITGKTFVITGSLNHYKNRDELVSVIESLGGKVSGSVSKNTDYLINNDVESTSGKNKKARELGIPIISEIEFMEVI